MPIKIRPNPVIPDHEVLRKIGGGAYGEVWLARGVTGALRAVKVVWREDFEDARGFEREFEGILKFEPISRDHPALVNVLHVGRSQDGTSFYYYVMEIGDDVTSGQDINPVEYEPRTLRADNAQGGGVQWPTADCIDVGLRLAEALHHLHERGLAHRDVKPSNVIFVNGRAKLADIGLVAMRGQRTFVGTEGFVPPEGPGSSQADVYSLGKVLYEIATGKDRMAFPELPDVVPAGAERKSWLELNRIICDICEPRVSKRKIASAADLAEALRRLQRGRRRRRSGLAVWMTAMVLLAFAGWAGWMAIKDGEWMRQVLASQRSAPAPIGKMKVTSVPQGADVYNDRGIFLGTTNTDFLPVAAGEECVLTLRMKGFREVTIRKKAPETVVSEPWPLNVVLEVFNPPQPGSPWEDHLGNPFQPVDDDHESSGYVRRVNWKRYAEEAKRPANAAEFVSVSENGKPVEVALASSNEANAYCRWYRQAGIKAGFLTEDHEVVALQDSSFESPSLSPRARQDGLRPFRLLIRRIVYGEISITTDPPGVEVYLSQGPDPTNLGGSVGATDPGRVIGKVRPGKWQLYLVREGYKPLTVEVVVREGARTEKKVTLEKSLGVVFGNAWENSIGMRFAPVGPDLMASIWETRVGDYQLFAKESGTPPARPPDFPQKPDHPVVNVSREDAQKFCEWLTKRERKSERIAQTHVYRLPTDLEWSAMAGLREDAGISPIWRDARKPRVYPWGEEWLRGDRVVGNFADVSASLAAGMTVNRTIPGYDDGFAHTAPVGSFRPNSYGLHDLSGNVQEWVEDEYTELGTDELGVLRGGGWTTYQSEKLLTGSRNGVPPDYRDIMYGFRVVLAKVPPKPD